eukprot:1144702-Pelagomonas_calceolata.AAC.6
MAPRSFAYSLLHIRPLAALRTHSCTHGPLQLRKAIEARCVPLGKLRMLMDVLDAPMKQIVSLWERRDMQVRVLANCASMIRHVLDGELAVLKGQPCQTAWLKVPPIQSNLAIWLGGLHDLALGWMWGLK